MPDSNAGLQSHLSAVAPDLRPIAANVLAAVHRIDVVALDADGVAHTVLFAAAGEDPGALTHAVAASAWLSARLADWRQLAPDAGIHRASPARAVVVAERFHPDTLAMADLLGTEHVRLIVAPGQPERAEEPPAAGGEPALAAETGPATGAVETKAQLPAEPSAGTRFRTGLEAADLGFTAS